MDYPFIVLLRIVRLVHLPHQMAKQKADRRTRRFLAAQFLHCASPQFEPKVWEVVNGIDAKATASPTKSYSSAISIIMECKKGFYFFVRILLCFINWGQLDFF
jgi:hypothetical protein